MHLFIWFNSPCSLQMSLVSKYLPRTPGLRENLQTARKDFVTRSDLRKSRTKKCFEAPSLVCRRWFHPVLPKLRDESPPGWLEQRPRWLWLGGRAGLCSTRAPLCSPATSESARFPRLAPCHLLSLCPPLPCPARAAGLGARGAPRWPLPVTLSHKGERHRQGRGGCSAMASPAVAAGK